MEHEKNVYVEGVFCTAFMRTTVFNVATQIENIRHFYSLEPMHFVFYHNSLCMKGNNNNDKMLQAI